MKWRLTAKNQTHGLNTEIARYEFRITRAHDNIRVSVENRGPGNVREGQFFLPLVVARMVGDALIMACGSGSDDLNVVFRIDEDATPDRARPTIAARPD